MHIVKYELFPNQGVFMSLTFSSSFNINHGGLPLSRRGRDGAPPSLSDCSTLSTARACLLSPPTRKVDEENDETSLLDYMPRLHDIYNP